MIEKDMKTALLMENMIAFLWIFRCPSVPATRKVFFIKDLQMKNGSLSFDKNVIFLKITAKYHVVASLDHIFIVPV